MNRISKSFAFRDGQSYPRNNRSNEELKRELHEFDMEFEKLEAQNKKMREALEEIDCMCKDKSGDDYMDCLCDITRRARQCLKEIGEEK